MYTPRDALRIIDVDAEVIVTLIEPMEEGWVCVWGGRG